MKLFAKLMIAVMFIAMMLPFTVLKGPDGKTLMSFSDIGFPDFSLPEIPDFPKLSGSSEPIPADDSDLSGKVLFYRWYDAQGNVQFTTEPPAKGIEYTVKGFDPDTNVIQAIKLPPPESTAGEDDASGQKEAAPEDIGNPYSQESIKKLFDDAKNIEKMLDQRFKDQDSALNQ